MKKVLSIFIMLLMALCQCQSLFAQTDDDKNALIKKVETGLIPPIRFDGDPVWTIEARMKHYGVPGLSIAVIKDAKIVWLKSYGIMDRESKQPVTSQTLFQAASISKPVSAYAALKEVERGKINADADVNQYLKSWKLPDNEFTKDKKVSLNHLLSHSGGVTVSGFRGYTTNEKIPTLLEVLDGKSPANSGAIRVDKVPGGSFRYSGGGYNIVQQMLIDIEGKSYPEIMEELVLKPVGMKNSTYNQPLPANRLKFAATGYLPDGSETKGKRHTYPEMAPAGLWTTAEDLARFAIELQQAVKGQSKTGLSKEMALKMTSPFIDNFEGLGVFLENKGKEVYFAHGGWNEGFSSALTAHRDKGYGVVILTNANQPLFVNELIRSVAATYGWPEYVQPGYKKLVVTAKEIAEIEGRYRTDKYEVTKIYNDNKGLFLQKNADEPEELYKIAEHTYIRRNWDAKVKVSLNPSDNNQYLSFLSGSDTVGYTNPKMKSTDKVPYELIIGGEFEKGLAAYKQLQIDNPGHFTSDEGYLNQMGYRLLQSKAIKNAIAIFRLNTILYPSSGNAFDSLGEAYLADGEKKLAKENYLIALKFNPGNENAAKIVKTLE